MQNPSKVNQPKLSSPIGRKGGGKQPYLKFKKKLRKSLWG